MKAVVERLEQSAKIWEEKAEVEESEQEKQIYTR